MTQTMTSDEIKAQSSGVIEEIIRMSDFNFDRLPMLDIIGERLADAFVVSMQELTGVICEASLNNLDYLPMGQALDAIAMPSMLGVVAAQNLNGEVLITMDATLALTTMELMLGGKPEGDMQRQSEEFTAIERGFARRLGNVVASDLQRGLSMVGDVELELDRIETDTDAATITQPANLCCRMRFTVALVGRTGNLDIIIPYDALEPIRPKLGKIHFGEPSEEGNPWRDQLEGQIERSMVDMEAILASVNLPIQTILNWQPGDTFNLWIEEDHEANVICSGTNMFRGLMGKRNNGNTAIRITEQIDPEEETENGRDSH